MAGTAPAGCASPQQQADQRRLEPVRRLYLQQTDHRFADRQEAGEQAMPSNCGGSVPGAGPWGVLRTAAARHQAGGMTCRTPTSRRIQTDAASGRAQIGQRVAVRERAGAQGRREGFIQVAGSVAQVINIAGSSLESLGCTGPILGSAQTDGQQGPRNCRWRRAMSSTRKVTEPGAQPWRRPGWL